MAKETGKTTLRLDGFEKLLKALKKPPSVHVGVLGDTNARGGGGPSNAEIGAIHEFGMGSHPVRSWLRMPLQVFLNKAIEKGITKKDIQDAIKKGDLTPIMAKIGIIAEGIVQDGFDTGGFGTWPPSDMTKKQNPQTLVETGQLRAAVTSEVVDE